MFAPVLAIWPTLELPPVTLFTSHVMVEPEERQKDAAKACDWPKATLVVEGEIKLVAEQVIVTVAFEVFKLSATLVAVTVIVDGDGARSGAV